MVELAFELGRDGLGVGGVDDLVGRAPAVAGANPLAEVDVQPQRQARVAPRGGGDGRLGGGRAHHEARRRDDAVGVRAQDAGVDGRAEAEVVGVDDEPAVGGGHGAIRRASARASAAQS